MESNQKEHDVICVMVYVIMHRFVLPKIKIVSYKDLISKEKNPNIRLDTKFFVENGDFKQR